MIHDKNLIERRFANALDRYNTMAVVQKRIAERLTEIIPDDSPELGVEIGAGSGFLTKLLLRKFPAMQLIANDITHKSGEFLPPEVEFRAEDGEIMNLPEGIDILATASTVQWFDDLPGFVKRARKAMSPNGIIAISTFGPENFREIEESLAYYNKEEVAEMIESAGFTILHIEDWLESMTFKNPLEVLRHIKATGLNAVSSKRWGSKRLQNLIANYPDPATLTFHPILIVAKVDAAR